jgi:uncharacterized protein
MLLRGLERHLPILRAERARHMSTLILPVVAFGASLLTFLSGFGLGTLLLPVFALFFPLEVAVGLTAVVHLLNNLFKLALLWRAVDRRVLVLFGLPGIAGAWMGAQLLMRLGAFGPLYNGVNGPVSVTATVIGALMLVFAAIELAPPRQQRAMPAAALLPGGVISGFFGGLSGHQGALRSIFLLRTGLSPQAIIATGVAIAVMVDLTRIPVYLDRLSFGQLQAEWPLLLATTLAAFAGAWWGRRLIPKMTVRTVQIAVGAMLLAIAMGLLSGALA